MEPRETPFVGFWDRSQGELLGALRATAAGLTSDEAKRRLRLHGPNSLVQERRFAALLSFVRFFANPLIIVLLVASAVSLSLGDRVGGLIIIAMVLLSVLLNFFMEFQARHAVEEIRKQVATCAVVPHRMVRGIPGHADAGGVRDPDGGSTRSRAVPTDPC